MEYETDELLEMVFSRPLIFCEANSLRELLLFMHGICAGREDYHCTQCFRGLCEYLEQRFHALPPTSFSWMRMLESEFGRLPLLEACKEIRDVLGDWRATRS
jgi:hypothetical protein